MRLSVKKAAYADLSRAACRKSGAVLGKGSRDEPVPQGRLVGHTPTQDYVLGYFQPSLRDSSWRESLSRRLFCLDFRVVTSWRLAT